MAQLLDRNRQIPGGFKFFVPETGWQPPAWASFDTIVRLLIAHRWGNPYLKDKNNWSVDYDSVANEVDAFNTKLCIQHGWDAYITEGAGTLENVPPKSLRLHHGGLRAVAVGAKSLVEFVKSGRDAVPNDQATKRAGLCRVCPKNEQGDWTTFFTEPVAEEIREKLTLRKKWNLSTPYDTELAVCSACMCPLPLMVHFPLDIKLKHMPPEAFDALWDHCWIRKEKAGQPI